MIEALEIDGVYLIEPSRFGDERGLFSEVFKASELAGVGFVKTFIQDNLARSSAKGVVRGLHFQKAPFEQDKLVRVSRGAILDVAVDLRPDSSTFGKAVSAILSAENWRQILVPAGFAHGYCTLEPDCEVLYKVTAPYAPSFEQGILWCDPDLCIDWPISAEEVVINNRDAVLPTLAAWKKMSV